MPKPAVTPTVPVPRAIPVEGLLAEPGLAAITRCVAGETGLPRFITHPRIQKSGLMFAGHMNGIVPTRVQILGETEISYMETLSPALLRERIEQVCAQELCCLIVTRGVEPPAALIDGANASGTPVIVSTQRSSRTIREIHTALDRLLAPEVQLHGVLVDIHGVGVLLLGESGIGKSECALFLVERGHRLVADDQVILRLTPTGRIEGRSPPLLRHHLEVRGLGILNIRDLFGATAVRSEIPVDLVVELCPWKENEDYERLGLDSLTWEVLGILLPRLRIPVSPGRDMGVILEVAARNELLKQMGENPAEKFTRRLESSLGLPGPPRMPSEFTPPPVQVRDTDAGPLVDGKDADE